MKVDIKEYKKQLKHEEKQFEKQRQDKLKEELKNKRKGDNLEANKLILDERRRRAEKKKINEIKKIAARISKMKT